MPTNMHELSTKAIKYYRSNCAKVPDNYSKEMTEDAKRLAIRNELKRHNSMLADAAHDAGVVEQRDYAIFQNYGYKGLYGGLGAKEIHNKKHQSLKHD